MSVGCLHSAVACELCTNVFRQQHINNQQLTDRVLKSISEERRPCLESNFRKTT